MTRLEENQMVIEEMIKRAKNKPTGTYEEMVTFQLGAIASILGDISKSLAILASESEKEQARIDMEKEYYHKLMMNLNKESEVEE